MRLNTVSLIFRKELRAVPRDRRTLVATFILPIILYPGFIIAFVQVRALEVGRLEQETYTIGILGREHAPDLLAASALDRERLQLTDDAAPDEAALLARELQLLVIVPADFQEQIAGDTTARLIVQYDQSDVRSREALDRFDKVVKRYRQTVLTRRLGGLDPPRTDAFLKPVRLTAENRAPEAQVLLSLAGGMLVFLAVIMALTGAFYPAVDTCAGEKERGTIETLLVSPASRTEIVVGKYGLVLVMSLATAMLNLIAMGLTIFAMVQFTGSVEGLPVPLGLSQAAQALPRLIWVFVLLIPVSALFSALALAVATFARSTKEAQYYMLPLYLLALPLSAVGAVTGIRLNYLLDLVPVAGAAIVFRDLLVGRAGTAPHAVVVFLANCAYAAIAIQWAAGLFRREEILFREAEAFEWRFWRWRSFRPVNGRPTLAHALLAVAAGVLLAWYTSGLLMAIRRPILLIILQQVACVAAPPLALAALFRLRWRPTFRLRRIAPATIFLVLPLALGMHVLLAEFVSLVQGDLPVPPSIRETVQDLLGGSTGLWGMLVAVALVPALAEEFMFRGFVLSGLRSRMGAARAVVASALLFGLFHLNIYQLVFATLAGLVLGALALRTRSLLPPVLFHLTTNVLGVFFMKVEAWPAWLRSAVTTETHQHYAAWTVPAAGLVAVGSAWLLWRVTRRTAAIARPGAG